MLKSEPEEKAEKFIDTVENLCSGKDNIIYGVESEVRKPNGISPSTVGNRYATIYIPIYNLTKPEDFFTWNQILHLGELGADVSIQTDGGVGGPTGCIEIFKEFE